ncbi:MAG: nuclear transport factor 2 family protein [Myxococcales bacterium]|nr:nuclear transport factor 2 family protein [Myxococcales bacterium]
MISTRTIYYVAAAALTLAACSKKKEEAPGGGSAAGSAAGTGTGGGSGSATEAALPALAPVDEAGARKVVDAWLAAQNGGDFAGYQALYADKMEGIKRVGARTWRFDRPGWLADRQKMFARPMTVAARDVKVGGSAAAPTIELVQSFKQGRFADEGPKRLVLTKGAGGLQIAREEMVRSVVGGPVALGADPIALVVEVDGHHHVVISGDASDAWGTGPISGPFQGTHKYALRAASKAPVAADWAGRALAVYTADGRQCAAAVGTLRLLGGGTPHFGEVQEWDGDPSISPDGRVWSQPERARAVYAMGELYLIGELAITGDCVPAYATAATAQAVAGTIAPDDAARTAAAVAAFRRLPAYVELQKSFADDFEGKGPWAPSPTVRAYQVGARRYLVVTASEGSGCGDFEGRLAAVFADDAGALTLVSNPADGFVRVDALVDGDGDGQVELIGAVADFSAVTSHFTPVAGGFAPTTTVTFPFNDCGC